MSEKNERSDKAVWRAAPTVKRGEATVRRPPRPPVAVPRPPSPPRRRRYLLGCLGLPILLILCLLLAGGGYFWYALNRPQPSLPLVTVSQPQYGDLSTVNTPQVVFADALDPDGIAQAELWVNGQLVATQVNPDSQSTGAFLISQAWLPTDVGGYTLLVRAVDRQGFAGQSESLWIEIGEIPPPNQDASLQYIVGPGDTVESIAKEFGTTPEEVRARNPELGSGEPSGGDPILVPDVPGFGPPAGVPSGGGAGGPPAIGIPDGPPIPPPGESPSAGSGVPPFYEGAGRLCFLFPAACVGSSGLPLTPVHRPECALWPEWCLGSGGSSLPGVDPGLPDWGLDLCLATPGALGCSDLISPGMIPPAAPLVSARYNAACQVEVFWTDESTNEVGFHLYRVSSGAPAALIALTDSAGTFTDNPRAGGNYRYYVAAYNAAGETPSAPTGEVAVPIADCAGESALLQAIELDALQMTLGQSMDRLYCYYSVGGSPYTRVPGDPAEFMELGAGGWNIADYAGGSERLRLFVPRDAPLEVAGECLGWSGDALVNLGSFRQSHLPAEWDGRELSASSGQFTVTYRIQPPTPGEAGDTAEGPSTIIPGAPMAIVDPGIPPPYALQMALGRVCHTIEGDAGFCGFDASGDLLWDWQPASGDTRQLWGFKVYRRLEGEDFTPGGFGAIGGAASHGRDLYFFAPAPERRAPPADVRPFIENVPLCVTEVPGRRPRNFVQAETIYYSVQAVMVETDPLTGEHYESPLSEERWTGMSGCPPMLEVELRDMTLAYLPSSAPTCTDHNLRGEPCASARSLNGGLRIGSAHITWNCPPHCSTLAALDYPGAAEAPRGTAIESDSAAAIDWEDEYLDWGTRPNTTGIRRGNNWIFVPLESETDVVPVSYWIYEGTRPICAGFAQITVEESGPTGDPVLLNVRSDRLLPGHSGEPTGWRCEVALFFNLIPRRP